MCNLTPKVILEADYGTYKGFFAENFVAQEFTSSGLEKIFSWQEGNAEVEFLQEMDGRVIPIEVKSGSITKAKSLRVFSEKYKPPHQVIFSGKTLDAGPERKIRHYPLYLAGKFPL